MKKTIVLILAILMAFALCACAEETQTDLQEDNENPDYIGGELNLLCWTGYEEDPIIKGFEEKYGVKVNYKIAPTSTEMYAILDTAEEGGVGCLHTRHPVDSQNGRSQYAPSLRYEQIY